MFLKNISWANTLHIISTVLETHSELEYLGSHILIIMMNKNPVFFFLFFFN